MLFRSSYMIDWFFQPTWASQNYIRLVCEFSLRDVDAADGYLRVTCPDFNWKMNAELNRRSKETRKGPREVTAENLTGLSMEIALDGPLTFDEWEAWHKQRREAEHKSQWYRFPQRQVNSRFKKLVSGILRRR